MKKMEETPADSSLNQDVDLQDIDELLDQEDPSFKDDLSKVAEVKSEVVLDDGDSLDDFSDSELADDDSEPEPAKGPIRKFFRSAKSAISFRSRKAKIWVVRKFIDAFIFIKTRPKELFGFLLSLVKSQIKKVVSFFGRFKKLSKGQKGVVILIGFLCVIIVFLTMKNLKGVWLPILNPPIVTTLSSVADQAFEISSNDFQMFYRAFPRDPDLFLFEKFKVNLKPSTGHPLPMGAFEVVVELDSKAAAIEVQDRQTEFHDLIQREFETQTYPSILTDLGKQALKGQIKQSLDERLSQGWVEDVHFQTFILKP